MNLILGLCQRLNNPRNGAVTLSKSFEGSYANYSCDSGYELLGSPAVVCRSNGLWYPAPPICYSKQLLINILSKNVTTWFTS